MMRKADNRKGFTLVETLVAISILMVAIVGPMTIAVRGLQSAHFAKEQLTAVYLAQEAMEIIRMHRDQYSLAQRGTGNDNWLSSPANLGPLCSGNSGCGVDINLLTNAGIRNCNATDACRLRYRAGGVSNASRGMYIHQGSDPYSPYTRVVRLQDINGGNNSDEVLVTVAVSWQSSFAGQKTITMQSRLFSHYDNY